MRTRHKVAVCALLGVALLGAGVGQDRGKDRARAKPVAESGWQQDAFVGLFVPLNATDLHAPEGGFRISGWRSWSGQLKLLELAKDGSEVKKGEVIARFEFEGREALRWINERLQKVQADREQARISTEQPLEGLRVDQRRRELEAQLASLDVQRERAISRRQAELYKIALEIARFEAEAVGQRITSAERAQSAELSFHDQAVARHQQDLGRYAGYEARVQLAAPHDGVVRHAYHPRERRKVQKGDSIHAGQKLVAVAKDEALAVRFFVPEHRIFELGEGAELTVVSAASGEERQAVVLRVEFFPQELGFLRELPNLPNAREKAFAVTAQLQGSAEGLSAGTEVRVKVKGR